MQPITASGQCDTSATLSPLAMPQFLPSAHCWCFPLQVFRTDLITAMKIPDSFQLSPEEYYVLADPWRQEWEKGVQVPASAEAIPEPVVR